MYKSVCIFLSVLLNSLNEALKISSYCSGKYISTTMALRARIGIAVNAVMESSECADAKYRCGSETRNSYSCPMSCERGACVESSRLSGFTKMLAVKTCQKQIFIYVK